MDGLQKGIGWLDGRATREQAVAQGWNLLREEISLPAAVLRQDRLLHNARWMQTFIDRYGLKLAPHGKTTMAPRLFALQLEHGAWGITVATAQQARVAQAHGVQRVLMANELVGAGNLRIVSEMLRDGAFPFYCLVDSVEQTRQLAAYFGERKQRLNVLLEVGVEGGRCGVRDEAQAEAVLEAIAHTHGAIRLCGVEVYEGVLKDEAAVRALLRRAIGTMRKLLRDGVFKGEKPLLSGAGSAWYDVVAEEFAAANFGDSVELVLRPGCYLTHDVGAYKEAQQQILARNPVARTMHGGLLPALQVWAYVLSVPELGRAIVGLGKRDAAFDSGLPEPSLRLRPGLDTEPQPTPAHWTVTKMMDQHAFLEFAGEDTPRVGEMIGFEIAHPCLTFDKWRWIAVVDAKWNVVDYVETFF